MLIWREIPGFSAYEVSDTGLIRRHALKPRLGPGNKKNPGELLKPGFKKKGYRCFTLVGDDGKLKQYIAAVFVLLTFVGPKPTSRHEAAHGDGDNQNDCLTNLRWATRLENAADMVKHGTMKVAWDQKIRSSRLISDVDPVVKQRRSEAARVRMGRSSEREILRQRARDAARYPDGRYI